MNVSTLARTVALALTVFLTACQSTKTVSDYSATEDTKAAEKWTAPKVAATTENLTTRPETKEVAKPSTNVFYFEFDKAALSTSTQQALETHAGYLKLLSSVSLRIEGHADERGTREYNVALGERRALAVEQFLLANGVSQGQMEVISYGEEKPADLGHDEAAWAKNRRVELSYTK